MHYNIDKYDYWKGWDDTNFFSIRREDREYFRGELSDIELNHRNVLDIGFGNGEFLAFAREIGANTFGIEIRDLAIEMAKRHGITILSSNFIENLPEYSNVFHLIVAFDVLEHMSINDNAVLLKVVSQLLRPGGIFVARFPNGQSPFGRINQYGDYTHRSVLSIDILGQLMVDTSLVMMRGGNAFRPTSGSVFRKILLQFRNRSQDIAEFLIQKTYGVSVPLGLNSVVVLKKANHNEAPHDEN